MLFYVECCSLVIAVIGLLYVDPDLVIKRMECEIERCRRDLWMRDLVSHCLLCCEGRSRRWKS